jgi:hypothetical protein
MRLKQLPITEWDINCYNLEYYGYGDVDVFIDESNMIGERVWCIFRKKDLEKYNDDLCFDTTFAILCNDTGTESGITCLKGLNAGQIIPVKFNGERNPSIPLEWINFHFWR